MTETLAARPVTGRVIQPEDLLALDVITDAHLSPDGQFVAYAVKHANLDRNDYSSAIAIVPTVAGAGAGPAGPRPLTTGTQRDTSPRWSPDSRRLAFISDRHGKPQLFVLDRADSGWAGEPRQL